jgi:hypothetical protein
MKKVNLLIFCFAFFSSAVAQTAGDSSAALNLITTPNSPGFTILGISPQEIERPQTPTDLAVNILNNTDNFSTLPQNYSLEFAPAWIFAGRKISYSDFEKNEVAKNIAQTFTVSLASAEGFTAEDTRFGTGFRFSILRGEIDSGFQSYQRKVSTGFAKLDSLNRGISESLNQRRRADTRLLELEGQLKVAREAGENELAMALLQAIDARILQIAKEVEEEYKNELDELKALASEIHVRRIGWVWDFAGATALDFANNNFTNSYLTNSGLWTTVGFEGKSNLTLLATGRAMFQHANRVTLDTAKTNLDAGARILWQKGKFNFAGEVLYRQSIVKNGSNGGQWKYDVNAAFLFMPNKTLSFSLGKNFEDLKATYGGNLIAYLNLLIGLGSDRNLL